MTSPIRYSQPPVELSVDRWLLEDEAAVGCGVCSALVLQREEARQRNDWAAACGRGPGGRRCLSRCGWPVGWCGDGLGTPVVIPGL